jgi:hypothetical protein
LKNSPLGLPSALLAGASIAAVLVYWIGLQGPFILDDEANLRSLPEWLAGRLDLFTLLFERGAGTFGRPLSMASFALNAWLGGYSPYALKLGNLLAHLVNGLVIFYLLRRLLRRDPGLQAHASLYAAIVASLWLLHPLHASTVLYAVQRMAQLSSLFILLGLWLYVVLRERLQQGPSIPAAAGLLLGIPAMTGLAFLAKENGILLPLLCAVVELAWFGGASRPRPVRAFHGLYVVAPFAAALFAVALNPERVSGAFAWRDFTWDERLLSQARALCDYLAKLVAPAPPRMGVYTDDFALSTGLLQPPTTLIAILFLVAMSTAAWHWRRQLPTLCFGWFFFLAAHALEAGPLPLELYYEHRNYLPSVGVLTALVGPAVAAGTWMQRRFGARPGRMGAVVLGVVLLMLAIGTHGRARVWSDPLLIAESSLEAHPQSLRANLDVLSAAIQRHDMARIDQVLDTLVDSPNARNRSIGHVYRLYTDCMFRQDGNPADLEAWVTQTPMPLTIAEAQPFNVIYKMAEKTGGCGAVSDRSMGLGIARLSDRAAASQQRQLGRLRYQAASFLVRAGDWEAALPQARKAWRPNSAPTLATPLVLVQLHNGDLDAADRTMREAELGSDPSDVAQQAHLRWLRSQVDQARGLRTARPASSNDPS